MDFCGSGRAKNRLSVSSPKGNVFCAPCAASYALFFCFLKKLSEVRMLTTFYFGKDDHRWVTFISLKTINAQVSRVANLLPLWRCLRRGFLLRGFLRRLRAGQLSCLLKKLSGVRMLTTFHLAKHDHRWVAFYLSKNDRWPARWPKRPPCPHCLCASSWAMEHPAWSLPCASSSSDLCFVLTQSI